MAIVDAIVNSSPFIFLITMELQWRLESDAPIKYSHNTMWLLESIAAWAFIFKLTGHFIKIEKRLAYTLNLSAGIAKMTILFSVWGDTDQFMDPTGVYHECALLLSTLRN